MTFSRFVWSGSQHDLVTAVTQLFQEGLIQVVIGTKSLLGEGWDAPCVNSLIPSELCQQLYAQQPNAGRAIQCGLRIQTRPVISGIWSLSTFP